MLATFTPPSTSSRIGRPRAIDDAAHRRDLRERCVDELLAAEAGIHGHQQHEIETLEDVVEPGRAASRD